MIRLFAPDIIRYNEEIIEERVMLKRSFLEISIDLFSTVSLNVNMRYDIEGMRRRRDIIKTASSGDPDKIFLYMRRE